MRESSSRQRLLWFFISAYLIFWVLIGITGVLINLGISDVQQQICINLIAWSPTLTLIIFSKQLLPGKSFTGLVRDPFSSKLKLSFFLITLLIQTCITAAVVIIYTLVRGNNVLGIKFIAPSALLPAVIITLTAGATGEEPGWRGFALNILQEKHSPLKSSLILGLVWGFWHLPLWLISGFTGIDLVIYIVCFILGICVTSILITYFYTKSKNVITAMWIHFLFNFMIKLVIMDLLTLLVYISLSYTIFAAVLIIVKSKFFIKSERVK